MKDKKNNSIVSKLNKNQKLNINNDQLKKHNLKTNEVGGPKGKEPTRYGDWEKNGRCSDF